MIQWKLGDLKISTMKGICLLLPVSLGLLHISCVADELKDAVPLESCSEDAQLSLLQRAGKAVHALSPKATKKLSGNKYANITAKEELHHPPKSDSKVVRFKSLDFSKVIADGPFATWFKQNPYSSLCAFSVFAMAAFSSALHEAALSMAEADEDPRDCLWDIAKFGLLLMVLHAHISTGAWGSWYEPLCMPGFFIISGLLQQYSAATPSVIVVRVMRDNVMSNMLFVLFFFTIRQDTDDGSLWFLWAMAFYRISVLPFCRLWTHVLGPRVGGIVVVALASVLSWQGGDVWPEVVDAWVKPLIFLNCCAYLLLENVVFFAIGLTVDIGILQSLVRRRLVQGIAILYMTIYLVVGRYSIHSTESFDGYLVGVARRSVGALAFITCTAPLAEATIQPFRFARILLAKCGTRAIFGYYIHMLLRFSVTSSVFMGFGTHAQRCFGYPVAFVGEAVLLIALCSPLAARCFSIMVSPQWILNACWQVFPRGLADRFTNVEIKKPEDIKKPEA